MTETAPPVGAAETSELHPLVWEDPLLTCCQHDIWTGITLEYIQDWLPCHERGEVLRELMARAETPPSLLRAWPGCEAICERDGDKVSPSISKTIPCV